MTSLTGCSDLVERGFLPKGVTSTSEEFTTFWNTTWLWALGVGVLVWGLTLWCVVRYRRRKTDTGLPAQMQYNVPIEILYTVVPVLMVAVLFGKTVELDNTVLDTSKKPDVTINVVGKQWSWDFNYVEAGVYDSGVQAHLNGKKGVPATLPTLYLPVDKRTEFVLTARDVIHSFWVPQFLQKMDMMPGRVNKFQVTPTETGTFTGKCAELCGAYHSEMLFQVKVVPQAEYDQHVAALKARGQSGFLSNSLNRSELVPGEQQFLPPALDQSSIVEEGKK
ncbi:cytochrome c oxidase subunit II [Luteipulveratus sp. YIM 133132]|uniref:Cytochrome c oxidase subunit 2 n=1 Tax=Luteipulveratus flavus TaxID=3031728 RepID=A0ABT6C647_9MICO|nr:MULTISPECIES: cytochrome c oxidase subunit II [unclassified Luteipulveratus]MDE9366410.1 cytochrome c oxidase subunit II [Luteipulveratus sp. YIM 133132]MDF8264315.1 cytochrome c oxidase subunit II [Luteipulveratus sp. YIM 133296]